MGNEGERQITTIDLYHDGTWVLLENEFALKSEKHNGVSTSNIHLILRRGIHVAAGKDAAIKEVLPDTDDNEISEMVLKLNPDRPLIRIGQQREIHLVSATPKLTIVNFISPEKIKYEHLSPDINTKHVISRNLLRRTSR